MVSCYQNAVKWKIFYVNAEDYKKAPEQGAGAWFTTRFRQAGT